MKALIAVVVAILVLTVGGTAVVMAQEEEPTPPPAPAPEIESNAFLQKVAEILGISQEELISIFQQARQELRQDAFQQFLNRAVEEGLITEGEAQQILEWWEQRPEAVDRLLPRGLGFPSLGGRRMQQQGILPMPPGHMQEGPPPWASGQQSGGQEGWRQFLPPGQAFQGPPPWAGGSQSGGQGEWNPTGPPWSAE